MGSMSAALFGVVTVARDHRGRRAGLQQGAHSASSTTRATTLRAPGPVSAGPVDQRGPQGGGARAARSMGSRAAARQASQAGGCSAGITHASWLGPVEQRGPQGGGARAARSIEPRAAA